MLGCVRGSAVQSGPYCEGAGGGMAELNKAEFTCLTAETYGFSLSCLEKEMSTHSSVLAWRIPGTGESGGLPSMGAHRVGHY